MKLWEPSPEQIQKESITVFISQIEKSENITFRDFHEFRAWTVENIPIFWEKVSEFCCVHFSKKADSVVQDIKAMPGARWFPGAELNYAENLLRYKDEKKAVVYWNEQGAKETLTYKDLYQRVSAVAEQLRGKGIGKGDTVAAYMPNIPATLISFLATASLGATWSSCSPDFSPAAVHDRFSQISPKLLISVDGYIYKGKEISILENVKNLTSSLSTVQAVLISPNLGKQAELSDLNNTELLTDKKSPQEINFAALPAEHPLFVLYSSGTTGKPKCIVHSAVGILLEHTKEHALECGIKREDIVFYNTTCGWMMWNWLVGVLFQGATLVLFDGFALQEKGNILFDLIQNEKVSVFGTSAAFLQKIEELNIIPKDLYDLSALRSILSTGSRLKPESFDYVYKAFGNKHLSPIWGGTDLCGCLGIASMILPVHRGEIQTRGMGIDLDIVDENSQSIKNAAGEVIVRKPFPSMPLRFVNDTGNAKYKAAYFEDIPGVWKHGDLGILTENGGVVVLGRSDDTLNPGGVRIGAAEVTSAAEKVEAVIESMAVAQTWENDERIILFVILANNAELTDEIKTKILNNMPSPRHRPKKIYAVTDFPTTLSGKRSNKTVRDILNGKELSNLHALANPHVIEIYKALARSLT